MCFGRHPVARPGRRSSRKRGLLVLRLVLVVGGVVLGALVLVLVLVLPLCLAGLVLRYLLLDLECCCLYRSDALCCALHSAVLSVCVSTALCCAFVSVSRVGVLFWFLFSFYLWV